MKEEYIDFALFDSRLPFYATLAGVSYCDGTYSIIRPNSNVCCVEYVISGSGTVCSNGNRFTAKAGDTYILFPEDDHFYFSSDNDPWVKIWFNASGKMINTLAAMYSLKDRNVFHCNSEDYIRRVHSELARKDIPPAMIADRTALIFHELLQFLHTNTENSEKISSDAEKIKNYIDLHIFEPLNIETLARHIFKSTAQTIRIFKKSYGMTPYDYYLNSKIEKAVTLLENTNYSVKETAYKLGFCDEHYFSGLFKRKTGKKPSEYRKIYGKMSDLDNRYDKK